MTRACKLRIAMLSYFQLSNRTCKTFKGIALEWPYKAVLAPGKISAEADDCSQPSA